MKTSVLAAVLMMAGGVAFGQDADLTILVGGAMLDHGGVVEVLALPVAGASSTPQTITLTDRYARIELRFPEGASYNFRFRPVADPAADQASRAGMDLFATQSLTVGTHTIDGPDGLQDWDYQAIRVLPFAEYGASDPAERILAAWGQTEGYSDVPPANYWGARALPEIFEATGDKRAVGLICVETGTVRTCTPDPKDALLLEAIWWRSIAEGRLERLRDNALSDCYDSGGLFNRPERCTDAAGDGWPAYVPAD